LSPASPSLGDNQPPARYCQHRHGGHRPEALTGPRVPAACLFPLSPAMPGFNSGRPMNLIQGKRSEDVVIRFCDAGTYPWASCRAADARLFGDRRVPRTPDRAIPWTRSLRCPQSARTGTTGCRRRGLCAKYPGPVAPLRDDRYNRLASRLHKKLRCFPAVVEKTGQQSGL
jgi:hypothetical protein